MPCVTSAKWNRTLVLQIPIFIAIWIGLHTALEIHFCLVIRHQILAYWLNMYRLEITRYSDDPWWREFYINFKFSRLQFGSHPIGSTQIEQIMQQLQMRDGHLLCPGSPRPMQVPTTSRLLSTRTGEPPNLFHLWDIISHSTSTCWEPTQQSPQACA